MGLYVALLWLKLGIVGCCGAFLCGQTGVCRAGLIYDVTGVVLDFVFGFRDLNIVDSGNPRRCSIPLSRSCKGNEDGNEFCKALGSIGKYKI